MSKILVVATHPDDETLGCGGTLLRQKLEGHELFWAIATEPSAELGWSTDQIKKRDSEIDIVADKYQFSKVFNFQLPAIKLDTLPLMIIIEKIVDIYKTINPEIIYMPCPYDVHTDHQIIGKALQSTYKWFRHSHIRTILMYETPSETEFNFIEKRVFNPKVFIDITEFLEDKIEIMKLYKSEFGKHPFPRSEKVIRALATIRGSQSGFQAAEGFQLVYDRK